MRADPGLKQRRVTRWRKNRQAKAYVAFERMFPRHFEKNFKDVRFDSLPMHVKQFVVEKFGGGNVASKQGALGGG